MNTNPPASSFALREGIEKTDEKTPIRTAKIVAPIVTVGKACRSGLVADQAP
jgi:hypothetical protein